MPLTSCSTRSANRARTSGRQDQSPDVQVVRVPRRGTEGLIRGLACAGQGSKAWARDASLWTGTDEGQWLGWLGITKGQLAHIDGLKTISKQVKAGGFSHVMLLGMGGSSLGPEVMAKTFGKIAGYPELHVLDSTDPAQVKAFREQGGSGEDALHRLEQVGQHTGAEHLQAIFLRAADASRRQQGSGEPVHCHHRSRIEDAESGRERRLPPYFLWPAEYRGAVLGPLRFRSGSCRRHGRRRAQVSRSGRGDGAGMYAVRPRRRQSQRRPWSHPRHGA